VLTVQAFDSYFVVLLVAVFITVTTENSGAVLLTIILKVDIPA
jgi:hypothetical protein